MALRERERHAVILKRLSETSKAMERMGQHHIPEDLWEMPGRCHCGRPVVLRRRPWRWCMPDTDRGCEHRG